MIWPTLSILIALAIAAIITTPDRPPERTHIYWCYIAVLGEQQGRIVMHTMSLPCRYRTNTAISV